ncbi:MAG: hypothetical protein MTP17_01455 [Candidatus Midichloria sp.]|nr:MAG: hypothetical protein MTP17_01455 [Candidatus Midichloria sp.]
MLFKTIIEGFKVNPVPAVGASKFEKLYGADEAVITFKKGTIEKVDLFKLEEIYIGAATANTDTAITISNNSALDAKGRAQAFVNAISVNPVLRSTFQAIVVPAGDRVDEAKLILNRTSTGQPGGVSFKASVKAGNTAKLADQLKSLQVGTGIIEISATSLAESYSANNSVVMGGESYCEC